MTAAGRAVFAAALAGLAAGCIDSGTGYIEIKAPAFYAILLDSRVVDTSRRGPVVVRRTVGSARLEFQRDSRTVLQCAVDVRKDRVITVTFANFGNALRCDIQK